MKQILDVQDRLSLMEDRKSFLVKTKFVLPCLIKDIYRNLNMDKKAQQVKLLMLES